MAGAGRSGGDPVLVAALAAGATHGAAATQAGVSERTVRRRLEDPAFRARLDTARDAMVAQAVGRLTEAATEAADTLRALLGSELDFARLAAARSILEIGLRYREQHDLAERVAALEEAQQQAGAPPWSPRTA